jgi:hypothetical protein
MKVMIGMTRRELLVGFGALATGVGAIPSIVLAGDAEPEERKEHPFSSEDIAGSGQEGSGGVDQGKYGDCVFEASVAALARTKRGQKALAESITLKSKGVYIVAFRGEPKHKVEVSESSIKRTGVRDSATWADVLEAAMILSDPHFANGSHPPANARGAAGGGKPTPAQYALFLLSGHPASKDQASAPKIGHRIADALSNGQPVVAFCGNNDDKALVSGHEWTVMACDPHADRITLRNPWGKFGKADTSKEGIEYKGNAEVAMNLQKFGHFYKEVTFGFHEG